MNTNGIRTGLLIFFLLIFVSCNKDETTASSSSNDNESSWKLSKLEIKKTNNTEWTEITDPGISENLTINNLAQVMTRTVSDSDCTLTFIYNIQWTIEGMTFEGHNTDNLHNCQLSILHCPSHYQRLTDNSFIFEGFISDDERTLTATCFTSSDESSRAYRYTYTK